MTRHEIDSIRKTINDLNAILQAGYIYIMVNPGWGDKVKIGYADDLEKRRRDFSSMAGASIFLACSRSCRAMDSIR